MISKQLDQEICRAKNILDSAIEKYRPIAIFAGFSGGYDSLVATHFSINHESSIRPLHLNTGIGIEKTREFVRQTSGENGWNLWEERTKESYDDFVVKYGFPGPAMHARMYNRLKERPLRSVIKHTKNGHHRNSTVMIITGIRHDESHTRAGYKRESSKVDSQVWVNPFYWATIDHFREYRRTYSLPGNPVKDKIGLSGECLCGAHASCGELARIRSACSDTADRIVELEKKSKASGHPWGYEEGPPEWWLEQRRGQTFFPGFYDEPEISTPGPMCHSCEKFSSGIIGLR